MKQTFWQWLTHRVAAPEIIESHLFDADKAKKISKEKRCTKAMLCEGTGYLLRRIEKAAKKGKRSVTVTFEKPKADYHAPVAFIKELGYDIHPVFLGDKLARITIGW